MQDGTPWPGNNVRDHPGMIQVRAIYCHKFTAQLNETVTFKICIIVLHRFCWQVMHCPSNLIANLILDLFPLFPSFPVVNYVLSFSHNFHQQHGFCTQCVDKFFWKTYPCCHRPSNSIVSTDILDEAQGHRQLLRCTIQFFQDYILDLAQQNYLDLSLCSKFIRMCKINKKMDLLNFRQHNSVECLK